VAAPYLLDPGEGNLRGPRGVRAELQDREPDNDRREFGWGERGFGFREARRVGPEAVRGGYQRGCCGFKSVGDIWGEND